jgi:hypothetical protein
MKILKPNDVGHGLLVEYDAGYISPDLTFNGKSNSDLLREFETKSNIKDGNIPDVVVVYAVLQKYDTENKNGRIYPKAILERENVRYQELIRTRASLGELNHPESSIIDAERVSHFITETWWQGKTLMGKLEIVTSPAYHKLGIISCVGDIVVNMLRKGITIGISSRGVGSLKKEHGKNIVGEDFELICWDIVTSPSTPGSYISTEKEKLSPFIESKLVKKTIINKLDKFLE